MTELYIVRHGRTFANEAGLKQGQINGENTYLNATGKRQAQNLAANFDLTGFDAIYVSPLQRTRDTAAILNVQAQVPVYEDERILEISYGQWDGHYNQELMNQYPEYFSDLTKDVNERYIEVATKGESFTDVEKRVADFVVAVTQKHPQGKIAVVTHGFTVRSFAINATKSSGTTILEPDNCSVTKILVDSENGNQHMVYYNRSVEGF